MGSRSTRAWKLLQPKQNIMTSCTVFMKRREILMAAWFWKPCIVNGGIMHCELVILPQFFLYSNISCILGRQTVLKASRDRRFIGKLMAHHPKVPKWAKVCQHRIWHLLRWLLLHCHHILKWKPLPRKTFSAMKCQQSSKNSITPMATICLISMSTIHNILLSSFSYQSYRRHNIFPIGRDLFILGWWRH